MTTTDVQVGVIMRERNKGRTQEQAAARANLKSRKTVAKYEREGQLPSHLKQARQYRTRSDPFVENWPQVEEMLTNTPEIESVVLFEWLREQQPGRYQAGQVRTFQRRVAQWRVEHTDQVAVLEQVHRPGEVLQTDGVWLSELGVSLQGVPFKHLLLHSVLPYSNWEWGRVVQSESLLAMRLGLQSTLLKLGYVPQYHQTDNSSAATYRLGIEEQASAGGARGYTPGYLQLLEYYGLQPRTIHLGSPQENGDVEASNGGLRRAVKQHLLLRGRCDFDSLEAYEAFLGQVMDKRNQARQTRLAEEVAVMKPLAATPLAAWSEQRLRVSRGSLIRVAKNYYSVPTRLIGQWVTVRVSEWQIEVYYGSKWVENLPRLTGERKHGIHYRHIVESLLRKPGGFRDYRYREALFPTLVFRRAWEHLNQWHAPRKADLSYLRILCLAARTVEADVAQVLEQLLASDQRWDEGEVERRVRPVPLSVPSIERGEINLLDYDQLLVGGDDEC